MNNQEKLQKLKSLLKGVSPAKFKRINRALELVARDLPDKAIINMLRKEYPKKIEMEQAKLNKLAEYSLNPKRMSFILRQMFYPSKSFYANNKEGK